MLWSFISCIMTILSIPKTVNLKLIKDNICLLFISIWSKWPFILSQKHIKFPVKSQELLNLLFVKFSPAPATFDSHPGRGRSWAKIGIPGQGWGPSLSLLWNDVASTSSPSLPIFSFYFFNQRCYSSIRAMSLISIALWNNC